MSQVPLTKIRVATLRATAPKLLEHLQKVGCVEITSSTLDESLRLTDQTDFSYATLAARIETAITFLGSFVKDKDALRAMLEGGRTHTTYRTIENVAASVDPTKTLDDVDRIHTRIIEIDARTRELDDEYAIIAAWERISLPLENIADTKNTIVFPIHNGERELNAVSEALESAELVELNRVSPSALLIVAHRDAREAVETALREASLSTLRLPHTHGLPSDELKRIEKDKEELAKEKETLENEARALGEKELPTLKQLADHAIWAAKRTKKLYSLGHTDTVTIFDGWVPKEYLARLKKDLDSTFDDVALEEIKPEEGEAQPTAIRNRGVFYPFEFITTLYGVPGHRDLDPTPFLSLFFAVFFGSCLSDVGYGSTLVFLTGFVLLRYKITGGMRQLMIALNAGGFAAIIMGMLYGGYFGVPAASLSPILVSIQKFDPIANPIPVFLLALTFGVIHIMFGIILDIVRANHQGVLLDGILDNVPWLLMFLVLIAFVLASAGVLPSPIKEMVIEYWKIAAIIAAALISVTKARHGKNIFDMLVKGVLALYGGVNYLSDILSYSRLLALGLATSALGYSVNLIAQIVGGPHLGFGTIFAILILLMGHTLNLVLSSLGAFIHSARLQFVEFFGKFMGDTGKAFAPLARDPKHTLLLPEKSG